MKALTIRQPWASLIALGVKHIETRSWRAPQSLIGQTIAIHAGKHEPPFGLQLGPWTTCETLIDGSWKWVVHDVDVRGSAAHLPLGAIVATATLADCLPMVTGGEEGAIRTLDIDANGSLWIVEAQTDEEAEEESADCTDVSDQLPYGDFAPGRWAWMLTNVQPTTERCPNDCARFDGNVPGWTRGSSWDWVPCGVCGGSGTCPPIPAKGKQGVWEWQP